MLRIGLLVSALGVGLRHGIDWDHIAAIGDLTGSESRPRRAFLLATTYAVGHAFVVMLLGAIAIAFSAHLPDGVDAVMERVVGITLLVLGMYVVYGLIRDGRDFRLRSRWMLVFALARRMGVRRRAPRDLVEIEHEHDVDEANLHTRAHDRAIATTVGFTVLVSFIVGLLISNTVVALAATFGFLGAQRSTNVYLAISILTAVFSLALGAMLVIGPGGGLPEIIHD